MEGLPRFSPLNLATKIDRSANLAKYALLRFRNALVAKGLPTDDVNVLLLKLYK